MIPQWIYYDLKSDSYKLIKSIVNLKFIKFNYYIFVHLAQYLIKILHYIYLRYIYGFI